MDHPRQRQHDIVKVLRAAHGVELAMFVELMELKLEETKEKLVSSLPSDIFQTQAEARTYKNIVTQLTRKDLQE